MRVERTADGFRATDVAGESVHVAVDDWQAGDGPAVNTQLSDVQFGPSSVEGVQTGTTTELTVPNVLVEGFVPATAERHTLPTDAGGRLPSGRVLWRAYTPIRVHVAFDGPARVVPDDPETRLRFPEPTAVAIGFYSNRRDPEPITVPETIDGLAMGLERLGGTPERRSADRSWPNVRPTPPQITFGERSLPENAPDSPATGITLELPREPWALAVAAPLVYYLGAGIELVAGVTPRLLADGWSHTFDEPIDHTCGGLLQRVFWLDCVVRTVGEHGGTPPAATLLDTLSLDAERLYEARIAERVHTYLGVDFDRVREAFPDWQFRMDVASTLEDVRAIGTVVSHLPLVRRVEESADRSTPHGSDEPRGVAVESVTAGETRGADATASADRLTADADTTPTICHGRLATGIDTEAFDAVPVAYDHRRGALGDPSPVSVVATFADGATRTEYESAAAHYEARAAAANVDPSVLTEPTVAELARLFESSAEFVHVVGHRDERGLACADGFLDTSTLDRVGVDAFLLNACGSHPEGRELVKKGAVAGGVTRSPVLDETATTVGVAFARLVSRGYCVHRALRLASRPTVSHGTYLAVGDGSYTLARETVGLPEERQLVQIDADTFEVTTEGCGPRLLGALTHYTITDDDRPRLSGTRVTARVDRDRLADHLRRLDRPTFYDGRLWWPDELRRELCE